MLRSGFAHGLPAPFGEPAGQGTWRFPSAALALQPSLSPREAKSKEPRLQKTDIMNASVSPAQHGSKTGDKYTGKQSNNCCFHGRRQ